jgi:3-methylfumaryl-CoA hydratase
MSAIDIGYLRGWIGRSETAEDAVDPARLRLIAAVLGRAEVPQDALPPAWHWCLFNPVVQAADLGEDGHPRLGGFMPPVPLPRRMWVGGRMEFHRPLPAGARIVRRTTIADVTAKEGRSGALVFVTLVHEIADAAGGR